tara:strand:- start:171 stop:716 length:546 start_codon:yes stop_codon:yes gene_type:complete
MFRRVDKHVHQYFHPLEDLLFLWREKLLEHFYECLPKLEKSFNVSLNGEKFSALTFELTNIIYPLIKKYYIIDDPVQPIQYRLYVQNNERFARVWHNHTEQNQYILGTIYDNIPTKGGEVGFKNKFLEDIIVKPRSNTITLFPYWMYHSPFPHEDNIERICINLAYCSMKKPIHKLTQDIW